MRRSNGSEIAPGIAVAIAAPPHSTDIEAGGVNHTFKAVIQLEWMVACKCMQGIYESELECSFHNTHIGID